jgi:hypothetical protein
VVILSSTSCDVALSGRSTAPYRRLPIGPGSRTAHGADFPPVASLDETFQLQIRAAVARAWRVDAALVGDDRTELDMGDLILMAAVNSQIAVSLSINLDCFTF